VKGVEERIGRDGKGKCTRTWGCGIPSTSSSSVYLAESKQGNTRHNGKRTSQRPIWSHTYTQRGAVLHRGLSAHPAETEGVMPTYSASSPSSSTPMSPSRLPLALCRLRDAREPTDGDRRPRCQADARTCNTQATHRQHKQRTGNTQATHRQHTGNTQATHVHSVRH
jgi:hypothetical protein